MSGQGLFTGSLVTLTLKPSTEKTGIVFKRIDLPKTPSIFAKLPFVKETPRCTILANPQASVQTVEHLLSAFSSLQIDHACIEIDGPELPACDGSALRFVQLIEEAGIAFLEEPREFIEIQSPIYWSYENVHLMAIPAKEFQVSYTLHYPHSKFLGSQFFTCSVNPDTYKQEIAPSRTFSLYEEIEPMLKKGILKQAGLDNGVIIKEDRVLNPDGVRFENEMARHKILDLLGDLSLIGKSLIGHIIAIRSGHFSNVAFAKKLNQSIEESLSDDK